MVRRDILPTGTYRAYFYPHGLFRRRRKPLTAKITQPYPAGALHIFTSSLPNAVWQLHFSYPAGALHPASSAAADYAVTSIFTAKRSLATSHLMRRDILPTGTDCARFLPARFIFGGADVSRQQVQSESGAVYQAADR